MFRSLLRTTTRLSHKTCLKNNFAHLLNFIEASWNVMAHAQKPDFVFRRNGRPHVNRRGRQFSRLLAAEVCALAVVMVVMLDTPCSEVVWKVLATHSIRQFPLHFPYRASPCAITFQLESTTTRKALTSSTGQSTQTNNTCAFMDWTLKLHNF